MIPRFTKFILVLSIISNIILSVVLFSTLRLNFTEELKNKQMPSKAIETNLNPESDAVFSPVQGLTFNEVLNIDSSNVYSFTCELIEHKPKEVTLTCADFGILIRNIQWDEWAATGASGVGIYSVLNCEPSCAEGTRNEVPVDVKLSKLMTDGSKYYLTSLNAYSQDGKVLHLAHLFPWDLSDFYLEHLK